jgi:hypothetical protein
MIASKLSKHPRSALQRALHGKSTAFTLPRRHPAVMFGFKTAVPDGLTLRA